MATDTWIVGLGEARSAPARTDVSITELAWEAVSAALDSAGVALAEIEGAVTASQDFWDGRTISSMSVNELVGGAFGSEAKVAADAALGIGYALARIEDGDQRLNVVLAHAKESEGDPHFIELAAFDPYYQRQLDPDETIVAAFQAQLLFAEGKFTAEHGARIVAAARERSEVLEAASVEQVLSSEPTADPLRVLDRAPRMDAASAMVVCDGTTAARLSGPRARIVAAASRTGAFWHERRSLTDASPAREAADDALALAGWDLSALDVIEINAPYAHQHLMVGGALGLGRGDALAARFEATDDAQLVNPSGGWLAGSAGSVAGLHSMVATVRRLAERGGRALIHSCSGLAAQSHHVVLVEVAG